MALICSYSIPTAPSPGSWAAPFRGPHPKQAGSLSSAWLSLTCEIDGHGHNDDDDSHDDEGDAEQPGQAAQPPGPVQVPLLHTTSRLQREGGRDLRKALPSSPVGGAPCLGLQSLPSPHLSPHSSTYLRDRKQASPVELAWTQVAQLSCGNPQPSLPLAGHRTKQCGALPLRTVMGQGGHGRCSGEDGGPGRVDQVQAMLGWQEQTHQAPLDPCPRLTAMTTLSASGFL